MRRSILILFTIFTVTISAQDAKFKEFYKANKSKAEISLNIPAFIGKAFIPNDELEEIKPLIRKTKNVKVMVFSNHDDNKAIVKKFKKFAKRNKLEALVRVKDKNDRVEIFCIEKNNFIREIIIQVNSNEGELVFLGLKTKITQDQLAKMFSEHVDVASLN